MKFHKIHFTKLFPSRTTMSNGEILQEYANSIKNLKKQYTDVGLSENEFKSLYFQCLTSLEVTERIERSTPRQFLSKHKFLILGIGFILSSMYNYKTIYSFIVCNLQEYIYPGLRLVRRMAIPVISLFPTLTDLYHETCLIHNPFFSVVDMDCWPCASISNVQEVADPNTVSQQYSAPFIYKTEQQTINFDELKELYFRNRNIFDKESSKILTNNEYYLSPSDIFSQQVLLDKNFYIWKFNNMNVAKLLRQIIKRPKVVPKFGQSTERFILLDTSQQSFHIPDTECSFSFLLSLSGSRVVDLIPAEECKHQCKTLKVELKETYLLWYNWWYWRPMVQYSMGNGTFIAHVGSYC